MFISRMPGCSRYIRYDFRFAFLMQIKVSPYKDFSHPGTFRFPHRRVTSQGVQNKCRLGRGPCQPSGGKRGPSPPVPGTPLGKGATGHGIP